ncbi:MAG: enoyl-CoA hydratase/isomerase family protein [Acidobacteriia bacterium]|nr:enoyl-CoA hydratase/isomerase family protein [Terriglobia bacterium]
MSSNKLIFKIENSIACITLNRPEKRNALDFELIEELKKSFRDAGSNKVVKAIGLSGAGRDFCAGMDLSVLQKIQQLDVMENIEDAQSLMELIVLMRKIPKPIVAVVQGRALAGGCGLATACDLILAARSAQFAYTETKVGFVPAIVSALARRALGEKRAFELLVLAEPITAVEAERIGLINKVFDDDRLEREAGEYLSTLTRLSASAVALTKSLLYSTDGMPWEQALRVGVDVNTLARMTEDCRKGVAGFLKKNE